MSTRRLYYDDAMLQEFVAQVLSCEPIAGREAAADTHPTWAAILDQTAFYPTSGGQPNDTGSLGEARLLDVLDEGDRIVHIVDQPLPLGSVSASIDWQRRFDHMQQHTGQHLLSAILQTRFSLPTVSFHVGTSVSTIDLRGKEPTVEVLEGAQHAVNQVIFEDRPVTIRYGTADELAKIGVRKQVERQGTLRAVEIEGIDLQPCGGTHIGATGQIGLLLIRRCTKIRQDWRLEFVCGGRAEQAARTDRNRMSAAAGLLKCADEDVVKSVERTLAERDAQFRSLRSASERLAEAEARLVLQETEVPSEGGLRIVARVLEGVEPVYLAKFATRLAQGVGVVALLVRKECGHVVFAQHPSAGKDMNAVLKTVLERLGGKGGGTRDFARGALSRLEDAQSAVELAKSLLQAERSD